MIQEINAFLDLYKVFHMDKLKRKYIFFRLFWLSGNPVLAARVIVSLAISDTTTHLNAIYPYIKVAYSGKMAVCDIYLT